MKKKSADCVKMEFSFFANHKSERSWVTADPANGQRGRRSPSPPPPPLYAHNSFKRRKSRSCAVCSAPKQPPEQSRAALGGGGGSTDSLRPGRCIFKTLLHYNRIKQSIKCQFGLCVRCCLPQAALLASLPIIIICVEAAAAAKQSNSSSGSLLYKFPSILWPRLCASRAVSFAHAAWQCSSSNSSAIAHTHTQSHTLAHTHTQIHFKSIFLAFFISFSAALVHCCDALSLSRLLACTHSCASACASACTGHALALSQRTCALSLCALWLC